MEFKFFNADETLAFVLTRDDLLKIKAGRMSLPRGTFYNVKGEKIFSIEKYVQAVIKNNL